MNVNPADRDIGGLGIYIVKNIMNQVTYQRLEGKNLLTMKKVIWENWRIEELKDWKIRKLDNN